MVFDLSKTRSLTTSNTRDFLWPIVGVLFILECVKLFIRVVYENFKQFATRHFRAMASRRNFKIAWFVSSQRLNYTIVETNFAHLFRQFKAGFIFGTVANSSTPSRIRLNPIGKPPDSFVEQWTKTGLFLPCLLWGFRFSVQRQGLRV